MIQEQETQTNDLNSDTLELVNEQDLHTITGGCDKCTITARASENRKKALDIKSGTAPIIDDALKFAKLAQNAEELANEAKSRANTSEPCPYHEFFGKRLDNIIRAENGQSLRVLIR